MTARHRARPLLLATSALLAASAAPAAIVAETTASFAPRQGRAVAIDSGRRPPLLELPELDDAVVVEKNHRRRNQGRANLESSASSTVSGVVSRGGAEPASQMAKELSGAAYFTIVDTLLRRAFKGLGIAFPSHLGGCFLLFLAMSLVQAVRPGWGDAAFELMTPGGAWLTRWMPVFFVPGLAMLPLAPSVGGGLEVAKVLLVVVLGFFYSLSTTSFTVLGLRTMQGAIKGSEPPDAAKPASHVKTVAKTTKGGAAAALPFTAETLDFLVKGFVLSGALSIAASRTDSPFASPLQAIFMGFTTCASYVWGARIPPPAFTKIIHPLLTSTAVTLIVAHLAGMATGSAFEDVLRSYKVGTLEPMNTGAGDVLLHMLGPAVVSFGLAMYSRRKLMLDNLFVVAAAILVSSAGGLFGTAFFVKLIKLGGQGNTELRLSMLPRNVTTPLAIAIINLIGGNIAIACSVVVLTGILGATVAARVLTAMGIEDPVSRGLGVGAAAQGLGTASMVGEKDAFPFAALSMVLTALVATTLASIPAVKELLVKIVEDAPVAEVVKEVVEAVADSAAAAASSS